MLNTDVPPGLRSLSIMVRRISRQPNSDLLKGFGRRLRDARMALGKKQAEFARDLGVTAQRLANWEADTHPPEPYILVQLKQYGISVDYLLTGDMNNLTHKLMQGLINLGATAAGHPVASEVRDAVRELPEPTTRPPRGRLHEKPAPPPRRFIHPPDVQQD